MGDTNIVIPVKGMGLMGELNHLDQDRTQWLLGARIP
jgi:hypothetical protein